MSKGFNGLTVGIKFVVIIAIATALGYKIDQFFFTRPLAMVCSMIIGIIGSFLELWYTLKKELND